MITVVAAAGASARSTAHRRWREGVLAALALGLFVALAVRGPIRQDAAYHAFADRRALLGVPNALDVLSNLAFLAVGLAGVAHCVLHRPAFAASWGAFFAGTALVFFGSAVYHWAPDDATLVWDRLPMTVAFAGLFVALLAEHVDPRLERYLLGPVIAIGVAGVALWQVAGDLRLYYWVQFTPLACIPVLLALFPLRDGKQHWLAVGLGCYVLAKIAEAHDRAVFVQTFGVVSGHTLKHLLAAIAVLCVLVMLRRRSSL